MRSEAEIRREVEKRFHRWLYLLLHGGLWVATGVGLYLYSRVQSVPYGWIDSVLIFLMLWGVLVALHFLRTVYVELREGLVRRAIERERHTYRMDDAYEKRKRDEKVPQLSEDGELVDFPLEGAKVKRGR